MEKLISDKNLKRAIVGSWIASAVLVSAGLYVIVHFIAKFW